ncbi:MAG TPA: metal-dependent hydrolase [Candidatus Nanoarchaeia archaeon]|nr:metal-dependent hydrolase [Candidatus Nanoarchaeia archaeon]
MMYKTHLALGFLIGILTSEFLGGSHPIIYIILVTFFSSLPDIDHPKSKIGRKFPFISWPINLIFSHRGFFHSVFPPIILLIVFKYFNLDIIAYPIAVGYIAHLLGDTITKEGITFFHPVSKFRLRGPMRTGRFLEHIIMGLILVVDVILILKLLNF